MSKARFFTVNAGYEPKSPHCANYYVLAQNKNAAKRFVKSHLNWLDVYEVRESTEEEVEKVQSNIRLYLLNYWEAEDSI